MKKNLPALVVLLVLLLPACIVNAAGFTDVEGETASAVFKLSVLGIIDGYPDGTFRPGNSITRAEFAKIAVTALGLEKTLDLYAEAPSYFSDVKSGDWYYKYVAASVEHDILKGYPGGTFKPDAPITEAEALTIILRLLGYKDYLPGSWPQNYALKAGELGLLETKAFSGSATATRAYVATVMSKALAVEIVKWDYFFQDFLVTGNSLLKAALKGEIREEVKVFSTRFGENRHSMIVITPDNEAVSLDVDKNLAVLGDVSFSELKNHYVNCVEQNGITKGVEVLSAAVNGEVEAVNIYTRTVKINGIELQFSHKLDLPPQGRQITVYLYKDTVYFWQ
ncbi:MAG: S-layer homology domain-containing protein [Firmicutes bacterium]|nr:S-layer homology domain-containing protein [Bacillota bacterium]